MIKNTLDPILFSFEIFGFNIDLRIYSLVFIIGALVVYYILNKNRNKFNLTEEDIDGMIFFGFINMIIFARLINVIFYNPSYYLQNLIRIFRVWEGGLSIHGGIIGFLLVVLYYSKKNNFSMIQLLNVIIKPLTLILALGRIANFFNHEIVGIETSVPWCVVFKTYSGCRHPAQLYEALVYIIIFAILVLNDKLKNKLFSDKLYFTIIFYSISRFFIEYLKTFEFIGPMTMGQYLSILTIIITTYFYHKKNKKNKKEIDKKD